VDAYHCSAPLAQSPQTLSSANRQADKTTSMLRDVTRALADDILIITDGHCSQKWRNLKQQWKKYVDKQGKTRQGRMAKPEFYDEIADIVGSSHTVQSPHTMETMDGPVAGPS